MIPPGTYHKVRLVRHVDVVLPRVILWQNPFLQHVPITVLASRSGRTVRCRRSTTIRFVATTTTGSGRRRSFGVVITVVVLTAVRCCVGLYRGTFVARNRGRSVTHYTHTATGSWNPIGLAEVFDVKLGNCGTTARIKRKCLQNSAKSRAEANVKNVQDCLMV